MNIFTIYILLRILSVGDAVEGGKEEGEVKGLHSQYAPHAGCGLSYKRQ